MPMTLAAKPHRKCFIASFIGKLAAVVCGEMRFVFVRRAAGYGATRCVGGPPRLHRVLVAPTRASYRMFMWGKSLCATLPLVAENILRISQDSTWQYLSVEAPSQV